MHMISKKIGLYCACLHCLAFVATVLYIHHSTDPQASLLWGIFAIIDFPVSLIYFVAGNAYSQWLAGFEQSFFVHIFYLPHLIHGLMGTIWWYFLPRLLTPKKIGGIWGRSSDVPQKP
jgi:threonine/homoserine/homoserine lactone efflux protein